jgi:hypothetical protein
MEAKETVIVVETVSDRNIGKQRIFVNDISTYRHWENRQGEEPQTVIVLKSGKSFTCNIPIEKLDNLESLKLIEL